MCVTAGRSYAVGRAKLTGDVIWFEGRLMVAKLTDRGAGRVSATSLRRQLHSSHGNTTPSAHVLAELEVEGPSGGRERHQNLHQGRGRSASAATSS